MSKNIIVVGGGAAGMLAAYFAAEAGNKVTLLEKNEKLGKKIYITGKGRCNLTNACDVEELFLNVKSTAVDYERSGVRAGYGNGVPLRDMRHNPLPQCRTTGCLYRNDPDVPLQRRERWDGGYYHTKTRRYAL